MVSWKLNNFIHFTYFVKNQNKFNHSWIFSVPLLKSFFQLYWGSGLLYFTKRGRYTHKVGDHCSTKCLKWATLFLHILIKYFLKFIFIEFGTFSDVLVFLMFYKNVICLLSLKNISYCSSTQSCECYSAGQGK